MKISEFKENLFWLRLHFTEPFSYWQCCWYRIKYFWCLVTSSSWSHFEIIQDKLIEIFERKFVTISFYWISMVIMVIFLFFFFFCNALTINKYPMTNEYQKSISIKQQCNKICSFLLSGRYTCCLLNRNYHKLKSCLNISWP